MEDEKERKIPVLSVWKNNTILKNIFIVNDGGSPSMEETLVVGRHPDCDIRLEHPSISRFHLRIFSKPSSFNLFLTDLSSVHGTWVSGKRIEPNVRTMMKEGDTLKIGGSSRVYKLHWIPLNQAYDMDHPFVPPLDFSEPQEDEEEEIIEDENDRGSKTEDMDVIDSDSKSLDSLVKCDGDELRVEEKNVLAKKDVIELVDSDFEGVESLSRDENNQVCVQNPNPETIDNEDGLEMDSILECLVPLFLGENWEWVGQEETHLANNPLPLKYEDEGFVASILKRSDSLFLDENFKLPVHKCVPSASPLMENMVCGSELKLNNNLADGKVQETTWNFWDGSVVAPCSLAHNGVLVSNDETDNQYVKCDSEPKALSEKKCIESDIVLQNSTVKEDETGRLWTFWSGNMGIESVCSPSSSTKSFLGSENGSVRKCYQSPQPFSSVKKQCESSILTPDQNSAQSIWSRRGKQVNTPQVLTSRTEEKKTQSVKKSVKRDPISRALFHGVGDREEEEEIFTPDKENLTPKTHMSSLRKLSVLNDVKHSNTGKSPSLFQGVDDPTEEEIFTPDKENLTPNTYKSLRKFALLNEIKHSNTGKSSRLMMPDILYGDDMSPALDKENPLGQDSVNQAQVAQLKHLNEKRVPFQTLLSDSPLKSVSEPCNLDAVMRSGASVCCAKGNGKDECSGSRIRKWNMIVDSTTLLNKESRKALELLEGLKGTQLIIPRIVLKELDFLKRQTSFFRRNSEVSSALEWVQDCMIKTQWWIHVQSSIEEGRPVAQTPPASPHSQLSFGSVTSFPLFEPRPEVLSPTAEDHVLDYALSLKKIQDEGQLVLLSNDITLKIKAMAEGLICEGTEEFRESLVNPFSERFLWADSSPRGQTWSCSDDIVLREKFYPSSLKMTTPKGIENVKGLKLILLHNSQYFERMTAIR